MKPPPESPSSRHPLLLSRVRQLSQWHDEFHRPYAPLRAGLTVGAGVLAVVWVLAFGAYGMIVEASKANAALFATSFTIPLATLAAWRVARWTRRRQETLAGAGLRAKVFQLMQEFPEHVQAWGGPQALCDPRVVAEALRHLEAS
ncbi:MAG: hypothetical protein U0746_18265 [Gemmataceae bacterium]